MEGKQDDLYAQLWRACAGQFVDVPRVEDLAYYYAQGHLEQVAVYTRHQQDGHMEIPVHNLASKILCRIMSVELRAEAFTDEVYAQVTLVPVAPKESDCSSLETPENDKIPSSSSLVVPENDQIPSRTSYTFSKTLTPSDTSTHGGFSVPKRHADGCFPPLDMTQPIPSQEIVAKDLNGREWRFRHIYRGHPKRHLLTTGWSTFVTAKKLLAGDSCIFVSGESGEIRVGVRRSATHLNDLAAFPSLISGQTMQMGILANASHAITTQSMFIVYYHPWTNPFEFIVPQQTYLNSTTQDYAIGRRVQLHKEVEESGRRIAGTIIGNEDIDRRRWPGSEWRRLKVQWDDNAIVDDNMHPERVCPWWIEILESAKEKHVPILPTTKKAHANVMSQRSSLPGSIGFPMNNAAQNSARPASQTPLPLQRAPIRGSRFGKENRNQLQLPFPMQDPHHKSLGRSMSFSPEDLSITSSNLSSIGSESLGWPNNESKTEKNDVGLGQSGSCSGFKLFGVSLTDRSPELPLLEQFGVVSNKTSSLVSTPPVSAAAASGKTCKKCCAVNTRSCTKVLKIGTALGRAVNLARFHGFDELVAELDSMFDFGGTLIDESSGWHVTCIDDDGDMMLLSDFPYQDLQGVVQKLIICPKDGVNNLKPSSSGNPSNP